MPIAFKYLHILFAFVYVGSLFATHWNVIAARRLAAWRDRETLFVHNRGISAMFGLPGLLGVGILGNLVAMQMGFRMATTPLMVASNALWAVMVVIALVMDLPASGALAALAHAHSQGGASEEPAGWARELRKWRVANGLQLLLFLVLLALMVAPW